MSKLTYKISYYALYAMFAVILVVIGLFLFGGSATGDAVLPGIDPDMWQPAHTETLLYLMYLLLGVAVAVTIIAAIFQFGAALKDNAGKAIKSLFGLVLLVAVLVVAWVMGDGTPMHIVGYSGTDNVPFWLKLTDMFLYSIYILMFVTIVAIIISGIKKKIS